MRNLALATALTLTCVFLTGCESPSAAPTASTPDPARPAAPDADPGSYTQTIPGSEITFEMASIPGGLFIMGSPAGEAGRREDEGPRHRVLIEPFWMGAHEVTWDEYKLFMREYSLSRQENRGHLWRSEPVTPKEEFDAITAPTPIYEFPGTDRWYPGFKSDGRRPAVNVTEFAAKQYTKWLSKKTGRFYRLPTEAEWEYACRAGSNKPYSFGSDADRLSDYAWCLDNAAGATQRVGRKKPNAWGLYDMHGNAAEWVLDAYDPHAYVNRPGAAARSDDTVVWPTERYGRVIRGGHFDAEPDRLRSAARESSSPRWHRSDYVTNPPSIHWFTNAPFVGLRVVRPVIEPGDAQKQRYWDADADEIRRGLIREVSVWFTIGK